MRKYVDVKIKFPVISIPNYQPAVSVPGYLKHTSGNLMEASRVPTFSEQ